MEITTGLLMYVGGIVGVILTLIGAAVYFNLSANKAKKLLKKIDKEDFDLDL